MRRASLVLCTAFAACKNASPPASAPTPAPTPAPAPVPTPAAATPDDRPSLTTASPLAPKLEQIVRALQSRTGLMKVKAELAALIPGFDGADLPDEAVVRVLVVRTTFPVMAFVGLASKGYDPCNHDESAPQRETRALYAGADRIRFVGEYWSPTSAGFDAEFFDGMRARALVPPIAATVPVIEVRYDYDPRCERDRGKKLEIFHLREGRRIGEPISIDTHYDVPGQSRDQRTAVTWLAGTVPGTALLAITQVTTEIITPCTDVDSATASSPQCRNQYSCARSTRVFVVTADEATEERDVETLRRAEPALAKVPADRSEDSERACARLDVK